MYIYIYVGRSSADAADPNPEHCTTDSSWRRGLPGTEDVINQLSRHTLSGFETSDPRLLCWRG